MAAIAMSKKKKNGKTAGGTADESSGGAADDVEPGPSTLEQHAAREGGELLILKDSSGAPSKVMRIDGNLFVMPIDSKGQISETAFLEDLEPYPEALNAGLWDGASAKMFGDFGWPGDIVKGHAAALKFVVTKLNEPSIEDFQKSWNKKHNDNIRTDGVLDKATLEAINKSK